MQFPMNCTNCSDTDWPMVLQDQWSLNHSLSLCLDCNTSYSNSTLAPDVDSFYTGFRDGVRFWIQRVLVPIIMVIGVIGNAITIVIMTRRRMKSSTNSYLAALATFDMLYLICTFILSIKYYPNIEDVRYYYYWYCWPFVLMICDGSSNTSIWLTVTFTIERYIAVCHPIKGKVICTESRAKRVVVCVFLVCFTYTIPTPFEWVVIERLEPVTNRTIMETTFSSFGQNDLYKTVYYYLTVILFVLVPFLLLAIFNAFLIRSVHLSRKQRHLMTQGQGSLKSTSTSTSTEIHSSSAARKTTNNDSTGSKQESRITVMLIAVVALFFVCQLPTACVLLYTAFHNIDPMSDEGQLIRGLGNIFNFLMAINAAGNFVLYCLLSQKYRRTFIQIFCPCLKTRFRRLQSVYQHTVCTNLQANAGANNNATLNFNYYNSNFGRRPPPGSSSGQRMSSGSVSPFLLKSSPGSQKQTSTLTSSKSANLLRLPKSSEPSSSDDLVSMGDAKPIVTTLTASSDGQIDNPSSKQWPNGRALLLPEQQNGRSSVNSNEENDEEEDEKQPLESGQKIMTRADVIGVQEA